MGEKAFVAAPTPAQHLNDLAMARALQVASDTKHVSEWGLNPPVYLLPLCILLCFVLRPLKSTTARVACAAQTFVAKATTRPVSGDATQVPLAVLCGHS